MGFNRKLPSGKSVPYQFDSRELDKELFKDIRKFFHIQKKDIKEIRAQLREKVSNEPERFLSCLYSLIKSVGERKRGIELEIIGSTVSGRLWRKLKKECEKEEINFFETVSKIKSPLLEKKLIKPDFSEYPKNIKILLTIMQELANFEEKTISFYYKKKKEKEYFIPKELKIIDLTEKESIILNPKNGRWVVTDKKEFLKKENYEGRMQIIEGDEDLIISEKDMSEKEKKILNSLEKLKIVNSSKSEPEPLIKFKIMPTILTIMVTNNCNFRCKYCYEKHEGEELGIRELDEIVSKVLSQNPSIKEILFFGGEPLLRLDKIRYLLLNELVMSKKLNIQTNGSLITPEIARLLKLHDIHTSVSIDGPKEENSLRVLRSGEPSYEKVITGIKNLRNENIKFGVISVLTRNNFKLKDHLFDWLLNEVGSSSFHINIDIDDKYSLNSNQLFQFFSNTFEEYVEKEYYKKIYYGNFKWIIESLIKPQEKRSLICSRSPCGAGTSLITILPNGNISPCPRLFEISTEYNTRGMINKFWDLYKVNINTMKECSSCPYRNICSGGCTAHYLKNKKSFKEYCKFQKKIIPWMMEKLYNNKNYLKGMSKWKSLKVSPIILGM